MLKLFLATMRVYHDFFSYQEGIYKHTPLAGSDRTGYHSVRIVGWGEEYSFGGMQKYWVHIQQQLFFCNYLLTIRFQKVANSWGSHWGENGYFRIVRGQNECEIETFVLATWPEIQSKRLK